MQANQTSWGSLAEQLAQQGLLNAETLSEAATSARAKGQTLIAHLLEESHLSAGAIAACAMRALHLPLLDLDAFNLDDIPASLLEDGAWRNGNMLPLMRRADRLFVAVADPDELSRLEVVKAQSGLQVEPVLVEQDKLKRALQEMRRFGRLTGAGFGAGLEEGLGNLDEEALAVETEQEGDEPLSAAVAEEAPIVRFVNRVLLDAVASGASDIHFEPFESSYRIRFRTDGLLSEAIKPPKRLGRRLAARLKVMAQLNIAERRLPQDGRFKVRLSESRALDLRVNTLPTLWGEKIVLRILDPSSARLGIDALGFRADQRALFEEALERPDGMILATGPTGSGKTVTLYAGINALNTPERNISTAEDPVEINLEGVNQVNINPKVGLDFASALRAFLRQDPDVLMVGEIRDLETAEIAVKAAQTGHLVLSTLHTNSAAETLTRLRNIGVPAFNLATSAALIIAQRLARRLCAECKAPFRAPPALLRREGFSASMVEAAPKLFQPNPQGCPACRGGYRGRVGVYEVVGNTAEITQLIMDDGDSLALAAQARRQGFVSLRTACLSKVAEGTISLVEANRITSVGEP